MLHFAKFSQEHFGPTHIRYYFRAVAYSCPEIKGTVFENSGSRKKPHMKKHLLLLIATALFTLPSLAQPDSFEDLLLPFVDAKYEKVLYKAERYTLDEKTKKHPLPYLFMSMSFFEISKMDDDKMKTKFPDAFKDAVKYVGKYAKLDKDKKYASEYADFFGAIRTSLINDGEIMLDQAKYTKAKSSYAYLIQMDANDAGAKLMLGVTFDAMKSKKEAETNYAEAKKLLQEKKCTVDNKTQKDFLRNSLITVANKLSATDKSKAKEWLDLGMEYFGEDNEYKITYESL
jgi:DNA-directed RNA polymerase subunit F